MAIDDLVHLRGQLPEVFADAALPPSWDEDWVFIPIDHPEADTQTALGANLHVEPWRIDEGMDDSQDAFRSETALLPQRPPDLGLPTTFAGAPQGAGWNSPMPPPDAFAFYLPFHYFYPTWWGVYIILENAQALAKRIAARSGGRLTANEAFKAVEIFLYAHEAFHHLLESFATRLEITHRTALYKAGFQTLYNRVSGSDDCIEELLATAHAYRRVKERFSPHNPEMHEAALDGLRWFIAQCPPGYRRAHQAFGDSAFERLRNEFAEANQSESLPLLPKMSGPLWHCFPHAFSGISRVTSRVNYVVRRNSPLATRLGLNLRYLRYRDLRERLMTLAKCTPVRQGKGSHEIWKSPAGHTFPVPRHPRDFSDGLVASIIKQAGLKMSLTQFLAA